MPASPQRLTAAIAVLVLGACAQGTAGPGAVSAPGPATAGSASVDDAATYGATTGAVVADSAERDRLESLYRARQDSALMSYTEADVAFMLNMIPHHAQALIMSRLAPENGASRSVRTLAARIINAQQDEIRRMQRWLRDRGEPVPEIHIDGLDLMVHGPHGHMDQDHDMPGMLTDAQLEELAAAKGPTFDRLFLTYMIGHHQGAVIMVRELFAQDGAGQGDAIFKLASDINVDQRTEIARMQLMLDGLPADDPR